MFRIFATMLQKTKQSIFERIGVGLSFACAIHCALTPIFIGFLPVVSAKLAHNHTLEYLLIGSSFLIVGFTNFIGFIKHHKQYAPLVTMLLGFSFIISGHMAHTPVFELGAALIGGFLIAYSIYLNAKAKQAANQSNCSCSH